MNTKAALELSITAIVVLIIAITVLGFAIYFIKTLFGGATSTFTEQFTQIQDKLRENMQNEGKQVAFSTGSNMDVRRGTPLQHYIGIRNDLTGTEGTVCYAVQIACLRSFSPDNSAVCDNTIVGGVDEGFVPMKGWYTQLLPIWDIKNNDFDIEPATLKIPTSTPSDTYQMELRVFADKDQNGCTGANQFDEIPVITERFRAVVN